MILNAKKRWMAFALLCLGDLMIVLDMSVVNIALPSIQSELGFSSSSLVWVVNAYLLTFGGFLLLGGRLGDLYGQRKLFLTGLSIFTVASLVCGVSTSQEMLIIARAVQGVGGAIASAIAFSLVITLFTDHYERAKAMGIFGFIMAGGGSVGVLVGGVLTAIDWHWNFLINIPIGILVFILCVYLLPDIRTHKEKENLDIFGAMSITVSLLCAMFAIIGGEATGWLSLQTLSLLSFAVIIFLVFLWWENRTKSPLIPLSLFRSRNLSVASIIGILWSAAMFSWFFMSALYMQFVLQYSPEQVGLAFLPANIIMALFSIGLSAKMVARFGISNPITWGLSLASVGLFLFVRAPVEGVFWIHVFPSMMLLGLGAGMAFNPVLIGAMSEVKPEDNGVASGVVNTGFMMGGSLGLAILVSISASRTQILLEKGVESVSALNSGYHAAFLIGGIFAITAAMLAMYLLKEPSVHQNTHHVH